MKPPYNVSPGTELYKSLVVLRQFQDWRTGKDIRPLNDHYWMTPRDITVAIDVVLKTFDFGTPITDCTDCVHNEDSVYCKRAAKGLKCLFSKRTNEDVPEDTQTNESMSDLPF